MAWEELTTFFYHHRWRHPPRFIVRGDREKAIESRGKRLKQVIVTQKAVLIDVVKSHPHAAPLSNIEVLHLLHELEADHLAS